MGRKRWERREEGERGEGRWGEWEGYEGVSASGQRNVSGLRDGVEAAKGVAVVEGGKDVMKRVSKEKDYGYKLGCGEEYCLTWDEGRKRVNRKRNEG